jgi:hypothetical protein
MKRPARTSNRIAKASTKSEAARSNAEDKARLVGKMPQERGNPFALFTEWSGEADEKAYAGL